MAHRPSLPVEFASFLESSQEPLILFDREYRILAANAAYRLRHEGSVSVVGRRCYEVSHHYAAPCDQVGESCPMANSLRSGKRERVVHLHHTSEGETYENIELSPLRDAEGRIACFMEKLDPLPVSRGMVAGEELVGRSVAFTRLLELVSRVAPADTTVLLEGESGTGKELVARAIHDGSPRVARPFAVVDCSGLPETLFESEVFGHERGAFTGATARKPGLIDEANGGTLFLDEVGDIPLSLQVKLLRLLESGTYRRVGGTELLLADVRLVSATNRSLGDLVATGRFRQDLFYRINTFPVRLPPLRERAGDIPLLVSALLRRVARHRGLRVSHAAMACLERYDYPGNVRELRNVLERASLMCDGDVVEPQHLPAHVQDTCLPGGPAVRQVREPTGALRVLEDSLWRRIVDSHTGTRKALAQRLGVSERTLYRRLALISRPGDSGEASGPGNTPAE